MSETRQKTFANVDARRMSRLANMVGCVDRTAERKVKAESQTPMEDKWEILRSGMDEKDGIIGKGAMAYREFLYCAVPLSTTLRRPKPQALATAGAYSEREAKKLRKRYKSGLAQDERPDVDYQKFMSSTYAEKLRATKVSGCKDTRTQGELYDQCRKGDYTDFDKLEPIMRDALAVEFMKTKMMTLITDSRQILSPAKCAEKLSTVLGHEGLVHPLMRLGISIAMKKPVLEGIDTRYWKQLDEALNTQVMRNTLTSYVTQHDKVMHLGPELNAHPGKGLTADVLTKREVASKCFLCKSLFLAHIGNFTCKKGSESAAWQGNVANAFAHGSRVTFTLPSEKTGAGSDALRRFRTSLIGDRTGFEKRGRFLGQEGIDIAVGGLHKDGLNGKKMLNDGSSGHLYRYYSEGNSLSSGSMILGFESQAPGMRQTHSFGKADCATVFGGQRVDEIGDRQGGRVIDASGIDSGSVGEVMERIDRMYDKYDDDSQVNLARIRKAVELLTGPVMDDAGLQEFLRTVFERNETELADRVFREVKRA